MPSRLTLPVFIESMAKHLPPSASTLRLLDVGAVAGETLHTIRQDIDAIPVSWNAEDWDVPSGSADAIMAYDRYLDPYFLEKSLDILRPGGRLIVTLPHEIALRSFGWRLERFGYTRLLVEYISGSKGVLIRGEREHTTPDTLARIKSTARRDIQMSDLNTYTGRYLYLLIQQTPNLPPWKLNPRERIRWDAVAIDYDTPAFLAFSSLPKAVSFMQPAVLSGRIRDVHKIPKFSMEAAHHWHYYVMINPSLEDIADYDITSIEVQPDSAEAPDE